MAHPPKVATWHRQPPELMLPMALICHKPTMTGNGLSIYTTYSIYLWWWLGDGLWHWFSHITPVIPCQGLEHTSTLICHGIFRQAWAKRKGRLQAVASIRHVSLQSRWRNCQKHLVCVMASVIPWHKTPTSDLQRCCQRSQAGSQRCSGNF
jgi:hypothetical protein